MDIGDMSDRIHRSITLNIEEKVDRMEQIGGRHTSFMKKEADEVFDALKWLKKKRDRMDLYLANREQYKELRRIMDENVKRC